MIGSWKVDHDIIGYYHFSPPPQPWLHQQKTKIIPEQHIQDIKENKVKFEVMSTLKKHCSLKTQKINQQSYYQYVKEQTEAEVEGDSVQRLIFQSCFVLFMLNGH